MKKLLLASILGLSISFPLSSQAGVNIFGVETPIEKNVVKDNVGNGYYVADDNSLPNTLVPQRLQNSNISLNNEENSESYYVFGVDIKSEGLI